MNIDTQRQRLRSPLVLLLLLTATATVAGQSAGDSLELTIPGKPGTPELNLRLRYCDKGKVKSESLTGAKTDLQIDKGFWISETEVSQKLFFHLLASLDGATLGRWKGSGARSEAEEYRQVMTQEATVDIPGPLKATPEEVRKLAAAWIGDDFPIFSVSLREAVLFCEACKPRSRGPFRYRLRLASAAEWEFACRASTGDSDVASYPYFHRPLGGGPSTEQARRVKAVVDAASVGGQEFSDALGNLADYLRQTYGLEHSFENAQNARPIRAGNGALNNWKVANMQGNVAEWVLPLSPGSDAWKRSWTALATGAIPLANDLPVAQTRGGHFRCQVSSTRKDGWKPLAAGDPVIVDLKNALSREGPDAFPNALAGIRLVVEEEANLGEWLTEIRSAATKDADDQTIAQWNKGVVELNRLDENLMAPTQAAIHFYSAIAYLRQKRVPEMDAELRSWRRALNNAIHTEKAAPAGVDVWLADLPLQDSTLASLDPRRARNLRGTVKLAQALLSYRIGKADDATARLRDWQQFLSATLVEGRLTDADIDNLKDSLAELKKFQGVDVSGAQRLASRYLALAYERAGKPADASAALAAAKPSDAADDVRQRARQLLLRAE